MSELAVEGCAIDVQVADLACLRELGRELVGANDTLGLALATVPHVRVAEARAPQQASAGLALDHVGLEANEERERAEPQVQGTAEQVERVFDLARPAQPVGVERDAQLDPVLVSEVFGLLGQLDRVYPGPRFERAGEINTNDGGRGLYFRDLDGHGLELITVPYGGWPAP